jgi:hypothetical protein
MRPYNILFFRERKSNMGKKRDDLQAFRQHDAKVFRDGDALFSQDDLRELINYIYSEYQYKGTQLAGLVKMIDFLSLESNRFLQPELAAQSQRLNDFLNTFRELLKNNFHEGQRTEEGDSLYLLTIEGTSYETEAFLAEFQMVSMDVEKAYKNYRTLITSTL